VLGPSTRKDIVSFKKLYCAAYLHVCIYHASDMSSNIKLTLQCAMYKMKQCPNWRRVRNKGATLLRCNTFIGRLLFPGFIYCFHECLISRLMLFVNINPLSVQPFKSHISVAAGALFNYSVHCGTVLSLSDKKDVYLMGHCCSTHPLNVKYMKMEHCN